MRPSLERAFIVGVILKGIDGAIEFLVGILLWISPQIVHIVLAAVVLEARESQSAMRQFIADYVGHLDASLADSGMVFLTVYLVFHGAIKVGLVYCLLRKYHQAYPIALVILTAFLAYQSYALVTSPSIALAVFTLIDAVIIYLIYREYRALRAQHVVQAQSDQGDQVDR